MFFFSVILDSDFKVKACDHIFSKYYTLLHHNSLNVPQLKVHNNDILSSSISPEAASCGTERWTLYL